ncbi:MAG: hypothetical protein ACM3ME_11105 [Chloroflexota bacterium]|jgi:membrane-associated phospholipid phosphatase|nr:hypothetical protein [Lentimicrobium sp.]
MEKRVAQFISIILHPMFIITWAMLVMFNLNAYFVLIVPEQLRWTIILLVFGNTALLPFILVWIMAKRNIISSMQLPHRQERTWPFLIFALFYASTYFLMRNIGLPQLYYLFIAGGLATIVLAILINLFWKISIHMIGIGGLTGGFLILTYRTLINAPILIIVLILLSGVVGFARLQSNTHSPAQVYVGYLLGFVTVAGIFLYF